MERKVQKRYIDQGLGFPIVLHNVSMMKVRGQWVPDLNYNAYMKSVLAELSTKRALLSGVEVKFIRQYFEMTLERFAARFNVSHVAVLKWEKTGSKPTKMNWSTEKDLRLFIFKSLFLDPKKKAQDKAAKELVTLYENLEEPLTDADVKLELDAHKIAA